MHKNNLFKIIVIFFTVVLFSNCESELDEGNCDISTLNIKGIAQVNGESKCYNDGSLIHDSNNNLLYLNLRNLGRDEFEINVRFAVPAQGLQLNQTYSSGQGTYDELYNFINGNIILTENNYPDDPTLLKFKGDFEMVFKNDDDELDITGSFSFEQP